MLRLLFIVMLIGFLTACSDADTLADEPPPEVVITGAPTWENGVGDLLKLKCGYCHAVPLPEIAPQDTVENLDLNQYETSVVDGRVVLGADSIGRWLFEGILQQPVTQFDGTSRPRQMPLDYGTQLTAAEMNALLAWSDAGSPRDDTPDPVSNDLDSGRSRYFSGCAGCHDLGGGVAFDGIVLGPPLRPASLTVAKIKSMWLDKVSPEPLSDQQAAAIAAFARSLLASQ